jgi:hypothetical protein
MDRLTVYCETKQIIYRIYILCEICASKMLHFHVINFYNILGMWMVVLPVWEIGSSQSFHLNGTTQTRHMESSVRAQGEFEMAALFQSGRRQCRP